ncbi:MAG: polyprenyl synthetase family protein [Gemmatimonadetes bacterium]|nr:polyprenyl synthetase family protein [Gemmatimonadota bacterium]MCB9517338.1 polyprenyl synthetase family protein [Gemmatimonadales bacterium]
MTLPQLDPVSLVDLQGPVRERLGRVEVEMRRMIEENFPLISEVNHHLLRMRGKMFRPTLALLADEATGGTGATAERFAAILELIHLATLVHDDSVDHSALRRGMPTINAVFSHQVSVIMGDFLYSRAVVELVRMGSLDALRVLARVTNEMTVGEMRQLLAHDPLTFTEEQYDLLIRAKTASLISGACEVGGLGAPAAEREALARFGEKLGMAFQIVDDLLDYTADARVTGKPTGLDLREHKVTLPLIHALPRFSAAERGQIDALMANPEPSEAQIAAVVQAVEEHGGLDYARDRASRIMAQADEELERLPPSPAREVLRASLGYVLERRR